MQTLSKLFPTLSFLGVFHFAFGTSGITNSYVRAYESAVAEANRGDAGRAIATLNCLRMANTVTVGVGSRGQASALREAVQIWNERLGSKAFSFSEGPKPDVKVIYVHSISAGVDVQGQVRCQRQLFWGSRGTSYKITGAVLVRDNVNGRPLEEREAVSVIEHELGHILCLDDDTRLSELMGPFVAGDPVRGPQDDEVETILEFKADINKVLKQLKRRSLSSRGEGTRGRRALAHRSLN